MEEIYIIQGRALKTSEMR